MVAEATVQYIDHEIAMISTIASGTSMRHGRFPPVAISDQTLLG
jgi:hypothetical protein